MADFPCLEKGAIAERIGFKLIKAMLVWPGQFKVSVNQTTVFVRLFFNENCTNSAQPIYFHYVVTLNFLMTVSKGILQILHNRVYLVHI